ncbi:MAG: hydantoinase/oxoprolinase family protein, partial [Pseudomonadota bacterium]
MSLTEGQLDIAVDIGGTFTDVAVRDGATGQVWRAKTPSTPDDPSEGFLAGMHLALEAADQAPPEVRAVFHGTTVATNMILEDRGARTALVTTKGFRHVLAIGRQDIPRRANLYTWRKPERPVSPADILEVDERIEPGGAVERPLVEESARAAADRLAEMEVEAVAVCLLHAFANPTHERRVVEILRARLPESAITASTDVFPVVREYERSLAAVLNATVMPGIASYVARLEEGLRQSGVAAPLLLMQSNGGVAGADKIRKAPSLTALSGPAAGVVGALSEAARAGFRDIMTVDIGGTSADISLIRNGDIALTQSGHVGDWPLPLPMVDIVTLGAGGGSVAAVVDGTLVVGPRSAGAVPGPAAYGR